MNITKNWLKKNYACIEGLEWFNDNYTEIDGIELCLQLINSNDFEKLKWANWLITRFMSRKQKLEYAIYAAELVLHIFEEKYPKDDRPRKAISAAKKCLKDDSKENRNAAADSVYVAVYVAVSTAADAAAAAASAAASAAADAADYSADAAVYDAADAANYSAYFAAYCSAYAAADAAYANHIEILIEIIKKGIEILKG